MEPVLKYRGRSISVPEVVFIRELIAAHPEASRRRLSQLLCQSWDWRQPNGRLCDMVCRGLMLVLDRAGHIRLPPVRQRPPNNVVVRRRPERVAIDRAPIEAGLRALGPLDIRQVRRTPEESLFNGLLAEHHYLGYVRPVGEHLKYLVWSGERPVAAMAWSSAPRDLGPRDRFIGWSLGARRRNIRYLAYNPRFLILPWVRVPHLASHVLGRMARRLSGDWQEHYGHPIYFLETFVYPARYRGTCYRAANWMVLGLTSGRGKDAPTRDRRVPPKEVLCYPLRREFRRLLGVLA